MRKAILALEDADVNDNVVDATQIDLNQAEAVAAIIELKSEQDQMAEARGVSEALDGMAEVTDASIASGEGLAPNEVALIDVALEHFCTRLGIARLPMPAMEGYEHDRLGNSKDALANLRALNNRVNVALEAKGGGIIDRIKNMWERATTGYSDIRNSLKKMAPPQGSEAIDLGSPAWTRPFASIKTDPVEAKDILKLLKDFNRAAAACKEPVKNMQAGMVKIRQEFNKNGIYTSDRSLNIINQQADMISAEADKLIELIPLENKRDETKVSATSCSKSVFNQLINEVIEGMASDERLEKTVENYLYIKSDLELIIRNNGTTIEGQLASAVINALSNGKRAVKTALKRIAQADEALWDMLMFRQKLFYSCYKYLQASSKA